MSFGNVEFERRVFPRFKIKLPITYQVEAKKTGQGEVANASEGGLMLTLNEPVMTGSRLRVHMQLSDAKVPRTIEMVGKVVWTKVLSEPGQKDQYQVGLAFEEISPQAMSYLKQFEALWLEQGS